VRRPFFRGVAIPAASALWNLAADRAARASLINAGAVEAGAYTRPLFSAT
jgi:hypothetical protein